MTEKYSAHRGNLYHRLYLQKQFRDGDISAESNMNVTSACQVVLDNYANSRRNVRLLFYLSSAPLLVLQHENFL